jgi:hypothetical protein
MKSAGIRAPARPRCAGGELLAASARAARGTRSARDTPHRSAATVFKRDRGRSRMSGRGRASYPPSAAVSAAALAAEPPRAEPPPEEAPRAPSRLGLLYTSHFARLQRALDDARPVDSRTPQQGAAAAADAADRLRCVVCLTAEKDVMFRPCKHVACCHSCAERQTPDQKKRMMRKCPMCRKRIKLIERIYIT